jgi:hypothetical protein
MKNGLFIKYLIIIKMIMLFSNGCAKQLFPADDELYNKRREYVGDQLRLDGYYYRVNYENKIFDGYFFYRNGIIITLGGVRNNLEEFDEYLKNIIDNQYHSSQKSNWGVFVVENDNIAFERWYGGPLKAYIRAGKILSDTTFHIIESYRYVDGNKTELKTRNEVFYFREFTPKPDSTNTFIP